MFNDSYYKRWYNSLFNDCFDNQYKRAQKAIDDCSSEDIRSWFKLLLNILKEKKFARVVLKNDKLVDVEKIAYTHSYASFFDIFYISHLINFSIFPMEINELEFSIRSVENMHT
jgi:hypothetical protein